MSPTLDSDGTVGEDKHSADSGSFHSLQAVVRINEKQTTLKQWARLRSCDAQPESLVLSGILKSML